MAYRYETHIPSRAEIVVGLVGDFIRRFCDRSDFARFVRDCPDEARRLARDLQTDASSLMKVVSNGSPKLLNRRLRSLGIDPAKLQAVEPAVSQDLARCCALCSSKPRCARDLARTPSGDDWRTYCPNEPTLNALGPALIEHARLVA
jgi:hypothetical protein